MMRSIRSIGFAAAVLLVPATLLGAGPLRQSSCDSCDNGRPARARLFGKDCAGGGKCAGLLGALANHPPAYPQKHGFGFFQPPFQAAPWYLYWPYDAHFQLPAPIGAPFQPPQHLGQPWNPYFAHPALGLGQEPAATPANAASSDITHLPNR